MEQLRERRSGDGSLISLLKEIREPSPDLLFDVMSAFTRDIYLVHQSIVGMRFQGGADELFDDLKPGDRVTFLREPDNRFDARAVMAIDGQGRKIGYIPRNQNAIISALLDAGKYFYGIVPDDIRQTRLHGALRGPAYVSVELYMREYVGPEDLQRIPRQGENGSYAVIRAELTDEEPRGIGSICAIKVINGEERGLYQEWTDDTDYRNTLGELIRGFYQFVGHLPLVGHGIEEEAEGILAEAYGVVLGKPFSNMTIDTEVMARNHLPDLAGASLQELDEQLDLYDGDAEEGERYCRMTWSLYRRMDRSQLERRAKT